MTCKRATWASSYCTSTSKTDVVRTCPRPQDEGQGTGDDFEVVDPSQLLTGPLEAAEQEAKHFRPPLLYLKFTVLLSNYACAMMSVTQSNFFLLPALFNERVESSGRSECRISRLEHVVTSLPFF